MVALCLDPLKFFVDDIATVIAMNKGFSKYHGTFAIVRATRVVAAGIGCYIFAVWERRRSSRVSRVADDLTHNLFTELTETEVDALLDLNQVASPPPILEWMADPGPNQGLYWGENSQMDQNQASSS